nr:hypothetical protein [Tanacetum cinerariifolium]
MRNRINFHIVRDDTLLEKEPEKKPKRAKKPKPAKQIETTKKTALAKKSSTMKTTGVVIKDTLGVSVLKKKAQAKIDRGKGMDLLSDVSLLEAAQLKKFLKRRTGTIPEVSDVPKDKSESENESWGDSRDDDDSNDDDSNDDVSDDEDVLKSDDDHEEANNERTESDYDDEEEEEAQDDDLKDTKPAVKEKGDVEMTKTETGDAELMKVPNAVREYLGTSLDDALYKVLKKHDADTIKEHSVLAAIVEKVRHQY